jgi:uncharacterized membrane protein
MLGADVVVPERACRFLRGEDGAARAFGEVLVAAQCAVASSRARFGSRNIRATIATVPAAAYRSVRWLLVAKACTWLVASCRSCGGRRHRSPRASNRTGIIPSPGPGAGRVCRICDQITVASAVDGPGDLFLAMHRHNRSVPGSCRARWCSTASGDNRLMAADTTDLESGAADRLIFFSDAVVAIAITLLALELPVPTGDTTSALWASVRHYESHYSAFLISFIVIAMAWGQHHHVMRFAERSDTRLRAINMLWLLTIVLNPFATKLLTTEGHDTVATHALRYGFYALLEVLASAAFLALVRHMVSRGLQAANMPARMVGEANWRGAGLMLGFGLSIPIFFATRYGWLAWIAGPVLFAQLQRHRRRREARQAPAAA